MHARTQAQRDHVINVPLSSRNNKHLRYNKKYMYSTEENM